jgi:hypothetical protein
MNKHRAKCRISELSLGEKAGAYYSMDASNSFPKGKLSSFVLS